jgi:hypothetical protein
VLWFTIWFLVILKIPAIYLAYVIWWAVKDPPAESAGGDGGILRGGGPGPTGPEPRPPVRGRATGPHGKPSRRPARTVETLRTRAERVR